MKTIGKELQKRLRKAKRKGLLSKGAEVLVGSIEK